MACICSTWLPGKPINFEVVHFTRNSICTYVEQYNILGLDHLYSTVQYSIFQFLFTEFMLEYSVNIHLCVCS